MEGEVYKLIIKEMKLYDKTFGSPPNVLTIPMKLREVFRQETANQIGQSKLKAKDILYILGMKVRYSDVNSVIACSYDKEELPPSPDQTNAEGDYTVEQMTDMLKNFKGE